MRATFDFIPELSQADISSFGQNMKNILKLFWVIMFGKSDDKPPISI
jgi:hypothetical protein